MKTKILLFIFLNVCFAVKASQNLIVIDTANINRLTIIKKNFKEINKIKKWTKIDSIELSETSEGGEATYYYQDSELKKIITKNYGETFRDITEYYLLKGKLSFIYKIHERYNRPYYYTKQSAKENNDTEFFDPKKSTFYYSRTYFHDDKKILQLLEPQKAPEYFIINSEILLEDYQRVIEFAKGE